jgi:hypothetical protein
MSTTNTYVMFGMFKQIVIWIRVWYVETNVYNKHILQCLQEMSTTNTYDNLRNFAQFSFCGIHITNCTIYLLQTFV